jgi:CubicO group peptidase (beta-lactamase class C family)
VIGHSNLRREAMTTDTIFDLASLTKVVATATSIMILVERGKLRLNDPVSLYIPELKGRGTRTHHASSNC